MPTGNPRARARPVPRALGAGHKWAGQGRGQVGCGRAWSRAGELTSAVAAENTGAGRTERAGRRAQGHAAAQGSGGVRRLALVWGACLSPLPHSAAHQDPTAGMRPPPVGPAIPSPSHSLRRPRDAMAREETPRNKETRRRRWRARGASGRAPSSPLPACRKVDGLEDEMPGSQARPRPGARDPTPPAPGAPGAALTPCPGPAP